MESLDIFDSKFEDIAKSAVQSIFVDATRDKSPEKTPIQKFQEAQEKVGEVFVKTLTCSCCQKQFTDAVQHREHFKLDWHRYNLKQSLLSKDPVSEEKFTELTGNDDLSSISGSDSETEKEDPTDSYITPQGKIFLQNENGTVFSMYACLLLDKKVIPEMESLDIFDSKFEDIAKSAVQSIFVDATRDKSPEKTPIQKFQEAQEKVGEVFVKTLTCSCCQKQFTDAVQHREHFKLDWHRYNLKQSLLSKDPVSEEKFTELTGNDDLSSISGSDSETEKEDPTDSYITPQGKIFLQNENGTVFSMYACLLLDKKVEIKDDKLSETLRYCCLLSKKWVVLLLGGGHFAGAVFEGDTPIVHKTFHCYTVRAGQGGAQSARDNKSGSSHPKSAGASLRRYNEQSFVQHVRDILDAWKPHICKSSRIFYRAAGPYNRAVLFGGNSPILDRNDSNLRTIPFSTRRATFTEVKRVHSLLSHAEIYESLMSAQTHFHRKKVLEDNSKRNRQRSSNINRSKSREIPERDLEIFEENPTNSSSSSNDEVSQEELEIEELGTQLQEINLNESLQEFEDTLTPEQRKAKIISRKRKPKKTKTKKMKEKEEKRKREMIDLVVRGALDLYSKFLEDEQIDEVLDNDGNTAIHLAALNEHTEFLEFLLGKGANICLKNNKQQTPYTCTGSREIRECLKDFARENPEKFNYNKAQIPTNALNQEELLEKRKAIRKIKKEKEKVKKKENEVKRQEELDKERFLKLSDREKRALAAERRILSQTGAVISRCFLCAADMTGKVPFEYGTNRFCSVECLKAHRLAHPVVYPKQ